jgi:hypothetical protein
VQLQRECSTNLGSLGFGDGIKEGSDLREQRAQAVCLSARDHDRLQSLVTALRTDWGGGRYDIPQLGVDLAQLVDGLLLHAIHLLAL